MASFVPIWPAQSDASFDSYSKEKMASIATSSNEKMVNVSCSEKAAEASLAPTELLSIDPEKERRLVRKIDRNLLPLVMAVYLLSFMDRVNIGNARLYNLEKDLEMKGDQFQVSISILFVTYVLCEIPSNLIMKNFVRPSRWIAFITLAWGLVATFSGLAQTYGGFLACRLLLGAAEAGLFPGMVVYLTLFYTKHELALRTAFLIISAAIAGGLGGLLAYGIGFMDGVAGMSGWRWIMIIEGIPTIVLAFICWFFLADDATSAYYLNEEDRALVLARRAAQIGTTEEFTWEDSKAAFQDWKTYAFALAQFCVGTMLYTYATFLPTIISQIMPQSSRAITQLLTIPPYAFGIVVYLCLAWISDKKQTRGPIGSACALFSCMGYIILLTTHTPALRYFGVCIVAAGLCTIGGINITWLNTINPRYGKRVTASGTQITIGNLAGISAPFLYPTADKPLFIMGHSTVCALVALASGVFAVMHLYLTWENKQRRLGKRDHLLEGRTEEEINAMGERNPRFVFTT